MCTVLAYVPEYLHSLSKHSSLRQRLTFAFLIAYYILCMSRCHVLVQLVNNPLVLRGLFMTSVNKVNVMAHQESDNANRTLLEERNSTNLLLKDPDSFARYSSSDDEADGTLLEKIGNTEMSSWSGQPSIKGSSETIRMALLTFSLIGVQ